MKTTRKDRSIHAVWLAVLALLLVIACSTRSGQMAGKGAATGAAAARGAVYGGSVGAVSGAVAGAQVDQAEKNRRDAQLEKLKKQIGEDAFSGLEALADCKHDVALGYARTAQKSDNRDYTLTGLWLEVLSYGDSRQESRARALFPDLVAEDTDIHSEAQAEETLRKVLLALMDIREQYNLPRVCQ